MVAPSQDYPQPQEPPEPSESQKAQEEPEVQEPAASEPSFAKLGEDLRAAALQLATHARHLAGLQVDRLRYIAIRSSGYALLGFVVACFAAGLLALGCGLLLVGLAGLLGSAFGNFFLGAALIGAIVVIAPILAILLGLAIVSRKTMAKIKQRCDSFNASQSEMYARPIPQETAHA